MRELDYNIIASGSSGNCVRIENIMIDCGVAFKDIEKELYKVKTLLITHIHSDHVKPATLKSIKKKFPRIKVIGNYEVAYKFEVDVICNANLPYALKGAIITPFKCNHDVICYGYVIQYDDLNIIYATDTNKVDNVLNLKFDYLFLESNYDEVKINQVISEQHKGYSPYMSSKRHLSTQQCKTFYFLNRRSQESKLIELHKSKRFY